MDGAPPGALGVPGQARPGEWLRKQRVAAGLTQEDLAERSGVSVRAIADLERGRTRRPYPSSVRALVQALGLPAEAGAGLVARYRSGGEGAGRHRAGAEGAGAHEPAADDAEAADGAGGGGASGGTAVPRQLPAGVAN